MFWGLPTVRAARENDRDRSGVTLSGNVMNDR
jgi:hypothetical protein